jgi:hypothetical protein
MLKELFLKKKLGLPFIMTKLLKGKNSKGKKNL